MNCPSDCSSLYKESPPIVTGIVTFFNFLIEMKPFAILFLVSVVCMISVTANCPNDQEGGSE